MPHTFTHLLAHIIFSTKDRAPLMGPEVKPRLLEYMGGIIRELGGKTLGINGASDHVHLLVWLPATVSVSEAMRVLKTNSSRWVHEAGISRRPFAWQAGYAAFSVSQSAAPEVQKYIAHQEEHHRKVSFQEELLSYLRKHGIEYDERYLWD